MGNKMNGDKALLKQQRKERKKEKRKKNDTPDILNTNPASTKKRIIRSMVILALLALAIFTLVRACDNSHFVVTFYEVEDEKIENHFRIAMLSDLHLKEYGKDNSELVNEIKKLEPDIIAMAGDMLDMDETDYSVLLTLCRQLVDVAPVYFCYGNHEKQVIRVWQTSTINVDLAAMGVHVLHNRYETIEVNGNLIDIGGLSANPGTLDADYTQSFWQKYLQTQNYRLLLVHYPQYFYKDGELLDCDIDMALCGHLHGGIVRIPLLGGLYHPTQGFFPELTEGCNQIGDTWVVVSRGIGGWLRVNNPPELVIIDLY